MEPMSSILPFVERMLSTESIPPWAMDVLFSIFNIPVSVPAAPIKIMATPQALMRIS